MEQLAADRQVRAKQVVLGRVPPGTIWMRAAGSLFLKAIREVSFVTIPIPPETSSFVIGRPAPRASSAYRPTADKQTAHLSIPPSVQMGDTSLSEALQRILHQVIPTSSTTS